MSEKHILINHPGDGDWIMSRVGGMFNFITDHTIALHRDGRIAGGVVFTGYLGAAITVHMAGSEDNWATRDFLWMVFSYGFDQLGCRKLLGLVASSNSRAIAVDLRLGFRLEGRISEAFPDGSDLLILSMTRGACKWLKIMPKHYRSNTAKAA